jgi:RNA polymerase sigma-70 factor (ECF subfamily)
VPLHRTEVEAIYRRLAPPIFRRCLKILRRPEEAADAAQEVFVRVLRHQDRLPPPGEQLRWAYAVATRICLNRLRDGAWETPGETATAAFDALASQPAPGFEWASDRQLVVRMLEDHDEDTKAIAWMVIVDGHTQEEAGQLLGLSRKTVGKKLNRFLALARKVAETA